MRVNSTEFFLAEHKVQVDVCGVIYWIVNGDGDVSSNEEEACPYFTLMAANRIIANHFPKDPTRIVCVNYPDEIHEWSIRS